MYAVVKTGGKQYRVEEGRDVKIDRIAGEPGETVELREVLVLADGGSVTVGTPTIEGARIVGTIAEQGRAPKIVVFKYKSKTRARKKTGHRQHFTRVLVEDILAAGQEPKPTAAKAAPLEAEPEAPKARRARKTAVAAAPADESPAVEAAAPTTEEPTAESPAPEKPRRSRKKAE